MAYYLLQADDELEDHDQDQDRDADVHVEGLAAHGDVFRVFGFFADAARRFIHITFQLVEEAELPPIEARLKKLNPSATHNTSDAALPTCTPKTERTSELAIKANTVAFRSSG